MDVKRIRLEEANAQSLKYEICKNSGISKCESETQVYEGAIRRMFILLKPGCPDLTPDIRVLHLWILWIPRTRSRLQCHRVMILSLMIFSMQRCHSEMVQLSHIKC